MIQLREKNYKKICWAIIALLTLLFTSKMMLEGAGVGSLERKILLLAISIIFLSSSKKCFWYLVMPMTVCYAIYSPIGLIFGRPSYRYIVSIFATDLLESKEFFLQIPLINYFYPFAIIFGIYFYRFITVKWDIKFYRNKTLISIFIIFAMLNQAPSLFFKDIIDASLNVKKELVEVNNFKKNSDWGKSTLDNSKYDNYILVIGESARKDYHHAYGYPIENTPFMSNANGLLVNGFTAGGANTISSLRLMLTKPDTNKWTPNYNLTLIDLVKSAGVKTFWISNQGYIGDFDTPISAIAKRSDHKYFLKYGNSESQNTSDLQIIEQVKKTIQGNPEQKKLMLFTFTAAILAHVIEFQITKI